MYLGYCKAGLCPEVKDFLSKALLQHEYIPITGHGESHMKNTHSTEHPFNGPGQGLSDGTNAWGLVYDKLDKVYQDHTAGGHFTDIRGNVKWHTRQGAFVDDVTLFHKGKPSETAQSLSRIASKDMQLWTDLLWTSGGAINFKETKTYTRIFKWPFTPGGKPFLMPQGNY